MSLFLVSLLSFLVLAHASDMELMRLHQHKYCNDGSPAGFWIRNGTNPSKWVIYLEGGGFCFDKVSCASRWQGSPSLMSSNGWSAKRPANGIMSDDHTINKWWADATAVYIGYCTSDSFSGDFQVSNPDPRTLNINFLGSRLVPAIIDDLKERHGLENAREVLFTGSSAGAEGLWVHADNVAEALPKAKVRTLVDSGWFLDFEPYKQGDCTSLGACTEQGALQMGVKIWNPKVNRQCQAANPGASVWRCILGYHAFPFVRNPVFVMQFGFDAAQMGHDGIYSIPSSGPQLLYAQQAIANLSTTFQNTRLQAYFSPNCYRHTIVESSSGYHGLSIKGLKLSDAIWYWFNGQETVIQVKDTCLTPNCNPTCNS